MYVPDSGRQLRLYPLDFCRNCGHEYYSVRRTKDAGTGKEVFLARGGETREENSPQDGYLYLSDPAWPLDEDEMLRRLPDGWLEEKNGFLRVKSSHKRDLPESVRVTGLGEIVRDGSGQRAAFVESNFKFCLCCGINYLGRTGKLTKLASLSSEGHSTATPEAFAKQGGLVHCGRDMSCRSQFLVP